MTSYYAKRHWSYSTKEVNKQVFAPPFPVQQAMISQPLAMLQASLCNDT